MSTVPDDIEPRTADRPTPAAGRDAAFTATIRSPLSAHLVGDQAAVLDVHHGHSRDGHVASTWAGRCAERGAASTQLRPRERSDFQFIAVLSIGIRWANATRLRMAYGAGPDASFHEIHSTMHIHDLKQQNEGD